MNAIGTKPAEYAFGILHWLGNRTYRPGIYSVILPKLTPIGFASLYPTYEFNYSDNGNGFGTVVKFWKWSAPRSNIGFHGRLSELSSACLTDGGI